MIQDVPEISIGCDSIHSWHEDFSHLWTTASVDQVIDELEMLLPYGWTHPVTKQNIILSVTGGEPLQSQKSLPELINHPRLAKCKHILFETNGSVPIKDALSTSLKNWLRDDNERTLTFSNSPKLSASGETWKSSIKPKAILTQFDLDEVDVYLKFVCDAKEEHFEEVVRALNAYHTNGIPITTPVYIMPMACTEDQQTDIEMNVALMCMKYGFIYAHRVHVNVFKNAMGT